MADTYLRKNLDKWPVQSGLRIGALNICSLPNKLDDLAVLLHNNGNNLHILGISESRCTKKQEDQVKMDNYRTEHSFATSDKKSVNRVGLVVYTHDSIDYERRADLEHQDIECLWLKIKYAGSSRLLVGFIYRNGRVNQADWSSSFAEMLDGVSSQNCNYLLLGDMNLNLFSEQKAWTSLYTSFSLKQLINVPTRKTDSTSTLIDHIYTNNDHIISEICVPTSGISDHFPTFCTIRHKRPKFLKNKHDTYYFRNFKRFKEQDFVNDLLQAPFESVFSITDPSCALRLWADIFSSISDKHAPMTKKRIKTDTFPPWLTPDIRSEMKIRDALKKENKLPEFKKQRNKVKSLIRRSKIDYFQSLVKNRSDPKLIWKAIKSLTNTNTSNKQPNICPDVFNHYFTNVATNLINSRPSLLDDSFKSCLNNIDNFVASRLGVNQSFDLPFMSTIDVISYLKLMKSKKSTGLDNINCRLMKMSAPYIADSLTYVYNLFIHTAIIPDAFKCAKCVPIHKAGDFNDVKNFRPISVLSLLCKPFERHIFNHLYHFFETFNLLHFCQSAFRKGHSCETALLNITERLYNSCNDGQLAGLVFIDFSKAFDMIDHLRLILKLKHYGISNHTLNILKSYLSNRTQSVCIKSNKSTLLPIKYGVPQGSILGPLLFSIFINDLPLSIKTSESNLFADDATLLSLASSISTLNENLNLSMSALKKWCFANLMFVNATKSGCMLVCTRQKRMNLPCASLDIRFNNESIPQVSSHRLLGIILDQNLTWCDHIDMLLNRISSKIYQLSRIKNFIDINTRKLFYFAYIQPYFDYCSSVWGHTYSSHTKRLSSIQRRALRGVNNNEISNYRDLFVSFNILPVNDKVKFRDCVLIHKILYGDAPTYLSSVVNKRTSQYFSYEPRLIVPFPNIDIYKMSFSYKGVISWNQLPPLLRRVTTFGSFKSSLLNYLLGKNN